MSKKRQLTGATYEDRVLEKFDTHKTLTEGRENKTASNLTNGFVYG